MPQIKLELSIPDDAEHLASHLDTFIQNLIQPNDIRGYSYIELDIISNALSELQSHFAEQLDEIENPSRTTH